MEWKNGLWHNTVISFFILCFHSFLHYNYLNWKTETHLFKFHLFFNLPETPFYYTKIYSCFTIFLKPLFIIQRSALVPQSFWNPTLLYKDLQMKKGNVFMYFHYLECHLNVFKYFVKSCLLAIIFFSQIVLDVFL